MPPLGSRIEIPLDIRVQVSWPQRHESRRCDTVAYLGCTIKQALVAWVQEHWWADQLSFQLSSDPVL